MFGSTVRDQEHLLGVELCLFIDRFVDNMCSRSLVVSLVYSKFCGFCASESMDEGRNSKILLKLIGLNGI
uniref:Uncharacterized protein n=1 Tax=Syphacia muris TaxID=451379 RepID=A0A0N5AEG1_9BILA